MDKQSWRLVHILKLARRLHTFAQKELVHYSCYKVATTPLFHSLSIS
jgi:hypothetical protein